MTPSTRRQNLERGDDVQERRPGHGVRVVEGHAVGHPGAAVVADHGEALVPEGAHERDGVGGHRALGVGQVAPRRPRGLSLSP